MIQLCFLKHNEQILDLVALLQKIKKLLIDYQMFILLL